VRVLVTGARGFVGSVLVPEFVARGHEVVARGGPASKDGLDVRDAAAVRAAMAAAAPDAVVHLAGITHLPKVLADPAAAFAVNVTGTRNVLEAVRQEAKGARVLVASSAAVYGSPDPEALPLEEGSRLLSEHPYGVQKIAAECLAERYREDHGLAVTIVRPFNHLGPGQEPRFAASWFAVQIARAEEGLAPPTLRVGNLEPKRDLLDVRDVVSAYLLLLSRSPFDGLFNVASGKSVRIGWILDWFLERCTTNVAVESDESLFRPMDAPDLRGSHARLTAATGWKPKFPLEETLAAVLEDARARAAAEKRGKPAP
jgi:GDP-4-dehydro-6-deoxy-D-mannose reductase